MSKQIIGATLAVILGVAVLTGAQSPVAAPVLPAAQSHEDFPFVIDFEQGAIQFDAGDRITINEVRGTSEDMQSGICRITGAYKLASEESATLAASMTARDSADGRGPWNSAQTMSVSKGHGTFTLMLPVSVKGWPHISFYSRSNSIGGIYLGAGDDVLQKWWGSK